MRKLIILKIAPIILASIFFCTPVFALDGTESATPTIVKVLLETDTGVKEISDLSVFSIQDKNYFLLRDIAVLMNFSTSWNQNNNEIQLSLLEPDNEPLKRWNPSTENKQAILITRKISIDNNSFMVSGYAIDGYSYFPIENIAYLTHFLYDWDIQKNIIKISKNLDTFPPIPENLDALVEMNLDNRTRQKVIPENNVIYISGSKNYGSLEKYMIENMDASFNMEDYVITESAPVDKGSVIINSPSAQGHESAYIEPFNIVELRFYVDGLPTFYGYRAYVFGGYVKIINYMGKGDIDFNFDKSKMEPFPYTDEELKQMAIEKDGLPYPVRETKITKYFDMETLTIKAQVETIYINTERFTIVKTNVF